MTSPGSNKKTGLAGCAVILIGSMIGSAIFSLSGLTMAVAGPAAILSWAIGGGLMLLYGLLIAELSVRYPESGGAYIFPRRVFGGKAGRLLGWFSCWSIILCNFVSIAFAAIYVGIYLGVTVPGMADFQIPLALGAVGFCLLLNLISFSSMGKAQGVLTSCLILVLLVYVVLCFGGGEYDGSLLLPFFTQGSGGNTGFLSVVPTSILGYGAVASIAFMVEEVKNPAKTVPKSMLIAIAVVICVYMVLILGTMGLISADYLRENPGMQYIPLFAACFTALSAYPWLVLLISIGAVLALLTTMLICMSMNARMIEAASGDGILPGILSRHNKNNQPYAAVIVSAVIPGIISCFPGFTEEIVNFGALFNCITIVLVIASFIKARKISPADYEGFRAPAGLISAFVVVTALIICNASSVLSGGMTIWIYTLVLFAVGFLIYLTAARKNNK